MAEKESIPEESFWEPERQEEFTRLRTDFTGAPRTDLWRLGIRDFEALPVSFAAEWKPVGPADYQVAPVQAGGFQGTGAVAGEVTDISIDPKDVTGKTLYVATNNGGIWKTTTGGLRDGTNPAWTPTMDSMESLSMGAVALDPDDSSIVYAGTGNPYDGGHVFNTGVGVYKSLDGGRSWAIVDGGLLATVLTASIINDIAVPKHDVVLVATNRGLFYSADGAVNFGANAVEFNNSKPVLEGDVTSLVVDRSADPPHLYAGVFGKGVFRSQDGGRTFPEKLFDPGGSYGLIALAQSVLPNTSTLVASIGAEAAGEEYKGLFISTDRGSRWAELPSLKASYQAYRTAVFAGGKGQTTYDVTVGIDPQNPQRIYVGFEDLFIANDGRNFALLPRGQVHADHHALIFSPKEHWPLRPGQPTRVYVGTDGGIYFSDNAGQAWTNLNQDLATVLVESMDMGRGSGANNGFIYAGAQDDGTGVHVGGAADGSWVLAGGGDGGVVAVSRANPQVAFGSGTGNFSISGFPAGRPLFAVLQQNPGSDLSPPGPTVETWVNLIALDPANPNIVYVSVFDKLLRSLNGGSTFTKQKNFSPVIGSSKPITALRTGPGNRVWVGLENGEVHRSTNGAADFDNVSTEVEGRGVEDIALDPVTPTRVAVVYSGYSRTNPLYKTRHVYLSTNDGHDWTDISGSTEESLGSNLPDVPCLSVAIDTTGDVIVSTDGGVARTTKIDSTGAAWTQLAPGMPRGTCTSLALDETVAPTLLRAATYGRSCFERAASLKQRVQVLGKLAFDPIAVGQSATLDIQICNVGSTPLDIVSFAKAAGSSADLSIHTAPASPVGPNSFKQATIRFTPSAAGKIATAEFVLTTNDPDPKRSPTSLFASGYALKTSNLPRLAMDGNLNFGVLGVGQTRKLPFLLMNLGNFDLTITSIKRTDGSSSFEIVPEAVTPITVPARDKLLLIMQFESGHPLGFSGDREAKFEIVSNDNRSPYLLNVTGYGPTNVALTVVLVVIGVAAVGAGAVVGYRALTDKLNKSK